MKVVLIGANGQLGTDIRKNKPEKVELLPLTRKDLDITDRDKTFFILRDLSPDVIINTAAFHKTDECEEKEELAFSVNTIAVKHLAEISETIGAKIVHISTDYVFDGKKLHEKTPYFESDIPNPINIYGLSKYAGEIALSTYTDNYLVIRISSVFGIAGASGKGGNFVYTILRLAKEREKLKVINDIFMSPTYTKDASEVIWKLILEEMPSGVYHAANDGICSWYEFATEIVRLAKLKTPIEPVKHTFYPLKAKRPLWSPLASEKGIKLRHWKEALKDFFQSLES
jgi:dTDP-4-dehydrorhamnose reductase